MGLKVIVVDDSAVMRSIIVKTLRLCGIACDEVYQAGDGKEALSTMAQFPVDLALIDINMPVMNGEELLAAIRGSRVLKDLKVVVVSSDHTDGRMERLRDQGVPIVHKPFNPVALKEAIVGVTGVSA